MCWVDKSITKNKLWLKNNFQLQNMAFHLIKSHATCIEKGRTSFRFVKKLKKKWTSNLFQSNCRVCRYKNWNELAQVPDYVYMHLIKIALPYMANGITYLSLSKSPFLFLYSNAINENKDRFEILSHFFRQFPNMNGT